MPPERTSTPAIDPVNAVDLTATAPSGLGLGDRTIQVDDKIYSTEKLASFHPGGDLFVKAFSGVDATEAFLSYHRRQFPHSKMESYQVGSAPARKSLNADADYLELCGVIEQILPRHKSFAPWYYIVKAVTLLVLAVSLEYYIHSRNMYKWYLTAPLGLLFAWIGMNIQHDANHGSISRFPIINKMFGYAQNWIGGSMVDWIHQHVVQHHVNTNDVHHDPDIVGGVVLRLNPLKPLLSHHSWQYAYIFVLLGLFGITVIQYSFEYVIRGFHHIKMSPYLAPYRLIDASCTIFFLLRWVVLPQIQSPGIYTVLNILPMFMVGGYYLAFFFLISHNFDGVVMFDKTERDKNESFLKIQTVTSSNVGGPILCFFNGGLNYQIEHHLFPRIQHSHYPLIAPAVRAFCQKKNIQYSHFPTIEANAKACVKHLFNMGNQKAAVPIVVTK